MADSTPTPPNPTNPGETPKKKRAKSPAGIKQSHLKELTKSEQVAKAAKKAEHAPKLLLREIPGSKPDALLAACDSARNKMADATQSATSRKADTAEEAAKMRALIALLQEVQAAAKQKYLATDPIRLQDYFVGLHLNGNRANLEQTSASIIEKLGDDTLPGITPEKVTALTAARDAWILANTTQTDDGTSAQQELIERDGMMDNIVNLRLEIQFAADAEWPYSNRDNEAVRRLFQLPVTRPLAVRAA